jgi:hypothetical protein
MLTAFISFSKYECSFEFWRNLNTLKDALTEKNW